MVIDLGYLGFYRLNNMGLFVVKGGLMMGEWISVTERLPESDKHVLVCGPRSGICVARPFMPVWTGHWTGDPKTIWWTKVGTGKYVSAVYWMPLPEPPAKGGCIG